MCGCVYYAYVYYLPLFWLKCVFLILSLLVFSNYTQLPALYSNCRKVKPALFRDPWPTVLRLSQRFFFFYIGDIPLRPVCSRLAHSHQHGSWYTYQTFCAHEMFLTLVATSACVSRCAYACWFTAYFCTCYGPQSEVFLPTVCVCALRLSGSLPGLRAWLREYLKPVHSGCEVWGRDKDLLKLQSMFISACVSLCVCASVLCSYICVNMFVDILTFYRVLKL